MNYSILNHLFLPHYLPSSADGDFLLENNHQNEHMLLECMKEYLNTFQSTDATISLSIFHILTDCIQRWSLLQNPQNTSVMILQSSMGQLPSGAFLPLYFHNQNAAILIEMDENDTDQPIISSWQVLLPTAEITSSILPHLSCFPMTMYRLSNRSQLISKVHCELLMEFTNNTIEYLKSYKASREVDEIRDVPESHYVCQWWIQQFQEIKIENSLDKSYQFKKKHRDHIRWNKALLPFRRSGLWMTIKVVFQTILTKRMGYDGIIIYKLLITHFLTHVISKRPTSTDVLVHCIRKIVRRLNKIEGLVSSINSNDVRKWAQCIIQEIEMKTNEIFPKLDWQKSIQRNEEMAHRSVISKFELNNSNIYQHLCPEFKTYLNNQISSKTDGISADIISYNHFIDDGQVDYIPSYNVLTKQMNYTARIALIRMEIWVESLLEQWLNYPTLDINGMNRFEILLRFFEEYQSAALVQYWSEEGPTDPIGYSRFVLTSLTILHVIHKKLCNDSNFERLKLHSINIPNLMNLFEVLVVPSREDMIRARQLYDYFKYFNRQTYPDILLEIESEDAFGVYYANQSSIMNKNISKIRAEAEHDKQEKIIEVNNAKERYSRLMDSINDLSCECDNNNRNKVQKCHKCQVQRKGDNIQVNIFECPLPSRHESAMAVIFELQMPIEIRSYRDILWQFINRPNPNQKSDLYEWLSVPPHDIKLKPYYTGPMNRQVRLLSPTKSMTQSHYSSPKVASTSTENFLFENSLKVQISPNRSMDFEDERCILTPQLDHPDYKQLQFTVNTTEFVQNQVIAQLSYCPPRIQSTQFVEFGSFRSGHRLQWWNLLTILEMESLPIAEESVAILILHSILQYGPLKTDSANQWCSESHEQLLADHFVDEFILRLNRYLDSCELNWQNELVLLVTTMITMRILTICNVTKTDKLTDLALKCRRTGEKWIDLISISIQTISSSTVNEGEILRLKMVHVGIACLLTFSIDKDRINGILSSDEHVISLLKAATTVHDYIILSKDQSNISTFMKNMIRFSERGLIMIQPTLAKYLEKTAYQSLHDFVTNYWAAIKGKGKMNGQWKKRRADIHDGWYDCQYESRYISIDCIRGTFLVDGMTVGFLSETITSNELFVRVFGYYIFEVQAAKLPNTYITKHSYHGNRRVHYQFHFNDHTKHLTITEQHKHTHEILQLIPHTCFSTELPDIFVSNHSHWWNAKDRILEFRPVHFKSIDFLDNKSYVLSMETGYVTTSGPITEHILVNQTSHVFQSLFNKYFIRLDDKPYVYMMKDKTSQDGMIVHVYLSRLGIAFKYNGDSKTITSREYSDMCIEENQWLGTLTSLKSGLLLSPSFVNNQRLANYPYRKLIVPFGQIYARITSSNNHQTVTINRSSLSAEFCHHYFVFIINDRLKILQSTDSPTGWLYLALLHAMTSHPLPDEYTGMTGMERAFQLLNSAGCWSDQPFDALSLNIIGQIAAISPKVNYYPEHLTCTEKIDWKNDDLPYSMQHFGYYLITKKLVETSQQLSFMYPSHTIVKIPEIFERKCYNEALLRKLYWNYRDSYNPLARLSSEMESDISCPSNSKPYQTALKQCSHATDYGPVRLVNDLYNNGNVKLIDCSKQTWLPLSQWLIYENKLNTIWIGLLKMVNYMKASETDNSRDEIERADKLIDFLHYVSDKLKFKPFHLQMLKTVLTVSAISLISIEFPPFINYVNIGEISVVWTRINLSIAYTSDQRNQIISAIENSWESNSNYKAIGKLPTSIEMARINQLLTSWQNNRKLRSFLESVQSLICSVTKEQFHTKASYYPQRFIIEPLEDHYRIEVKRTNKLIDQKLLSNADKKFHSLHSDYFNKSTVTLQTVSRQKEFINQIFPAINNQDNPLKEITDHFKNQLNESWQKLLSDEQTRKENPSIEEIAEYLYHLRQETTRNWNELIRSITESNEQLFKVGLLARITPTTLVSYFQEKVEKLSLTSDQRTLLGGILVNWTLEQQLERAMYFAIHNKWDDFTNEISNTPHSNWIPSEYIPWLIFELEMNIIIREIQIKVTRHMMETDDNTIKSIVMQMNMGEGKTSVILPMLALSLSSSSSSLVRIIVLKSLFPMNYQSLRYKFGGLLNRRIFPFACRRDMKFDERQIEQIDNRLRQGLCNCDVILTSPEDILSFDLLIIDKCRRNEFEIARSMLSIQRWIKLYVRDVLDESDEILHVKYQLIYTVGGQQQIDGGAERWKTIQTILNLVKKHAATIASHYEDEVCYKASERKSAFPQLRLQSSQSFPLLCERIAKNWIKDRNYLHTDRELILSFILKARVSIKHLVDKFSLSHLQSFLIVRGLLSSEVLLFALRKRYRVNYGINPNPSFNRLMAVPFRAKDVAADRTEFGHPDLALILTQLSYYYSGLNDEQLLQCLNRLSEKEMDPSALYDQWIVYEEREDIPNNIKQWKEINLKDYHQRTCLIFPTLQYNMLVINYFLNHFVFPQEAKQFPYKLVASAWDLSSSARSKIITGFSGTNDTQLLLPIHIRQYDLPELQKTDAIVVHNLLQPENETYRHLPINATSDEILGEIMKYEKEINVILDVGALFIDKTNRDIAVKWLNLSYKTTIDYAVYFDSDSIIVCDRQLYHHRFEISPASERLDHCIFYLDEIHTRGTDLKFSSGFKAAVTLGNNLTKDRFVQACMRMRKLGNGHSLTFWTSNEVHQQIKGLKLNLLVENLDDSIKLIDILRWVYENTMQSIWDGLHQWAAQSLNFQRKLAASRQIDWKNSQQSFTKNIMKDLARGCLEPEITELIRTYGTPKKLLMIDEIYFARYEQCNENFSIEIHDAVIQRLRNYSGKKKRLSQLLDEEHQRELELEIEEERQVVIFSSVRPCKPIFHEELKKLCHTYKTVMNLSEFPSIFRPLVHAFTGTTFYDDAQQCGS